MTGRDPYVSDRLASVSRELDAAIVRVRSSTGAIFGSGFVVDHHHIVTCAHVVSAALGKRDSSRPMPDETISVDFPLLAPDTSVQVTTAAWHPIEGDESGDIAVLAMIDDPPKGVGPTRLVSAKDFWGHPFRAFGFPRRHDQGVWVAGVLRASQGAGWVQMEGTPTGHAVEEGFSGGAVWDDELDGVVGMTVAAESQSGIRTGYLIPATTLARAWPSLAQQTLPPCPYRGLYPFRTRDASLFFGREDLTDRLVHDASYRPVIALVGPSGSGKSSLIFAGLLPRLQQVQGWITATMRPAQASSPWLSLSSALVDLLEPNLSETERISSLHDLAVLLSNGHLRDVIDRILVQSNATRLLLAVDQFEELFAGEWVGFVHALLTCARVEDAPLAPRFTIILALRADFLNHALHDPVLAAALEDSVITIGQMTGERLRAVIQSPLPPGVEYERGLVDRILSDVGETPGSLPLLEFALTLLWERQEHRTLTHAAYEELGGVDGALAAYAESIYSEKLSPEDRDCARRVFVQLARPSEVGTPVRRLARPSELGQERWDLAQRLAATRLLVTDRDPTGIESVELVHEALITAWSRFSDWIKDDRAFRAWQEQLRNSIAAWEKVHRDLDALLRGAPLAEAERWLAERKDDLSDSEADYIKRGTRQKNRATRRLRTGIMAVTALLLVASILGSATVWQSKQRATQVRIVGSRDLAAQAAFLARTDAKTAMQLAATSYRMYPTTEATRILTELGNDYRRVQALITPDLPEIAGIAFSPSDPSILALEGTHYAALWDLKSNSPIAMKEFGGTVDVLAFTPDGSTLALATESGGGANSLTLWSPNTGRATEIPWKVDAESEIGGAQFSSNGEMLLVCATDGGMPPVLDQQIFDLKARKPLHRIKDADSCAGFSKDNNVVYVRKHKVVVAQPRTHRVIAEDSLPKSDWSDPQGNPPTIHIAPDGRSAIVNDPQIGISTWWDLQRRTPQPWNWPSVPEPYDSHDDISFARQGDIAIVNNGGGFSTVDVSTRRLLSVYAYPVPDFSDPVPTINATGDMVAVIVGVKSIALLKVADPAGVPISTYDISVVDMESKTLAALVDYYREYSASVLFYRYEPADKDVPRPIHYPRIGGEESEPTLSAGGRYAAAIADGGEAVDLVSLNPDGHFAHRKVAHGTRIVDFAFDPTGNYFATARDTEVTVWSSSDGTLVRRIQMPQGNTPANQVSIGQGGTHVGVVDAKHKALVWLDTDATPSLSFDNAKSVDFSPRGTWLAVDTAGAIQIWNLKDRQKLPGNIRSYSTEEGEVAQRFSPDDSYVVTAFEEPFAGGKFDVWAVPSLQMVGSLSGGSEFAFSATPKKLVLATNGGVDTVSVDPFDALETICRLTDRENLTPEQWNQYASGLNVVAACP